MESSRAKVLVVDDDFDIREAMVDLLLDNGFEAVSAKDGREGLLEARRHEPVDVIVLDLSMPMLDGRDFRTHQLADPRLADIPVVVVSADEDARATATKLGVQAVLKKPFDPDELVGAVEACSVQLDARAMVS